MKIHIIGAGGIGSWAVPQLTRLGHDIVVWDGDTLEEKNLDRQLFDSAQIGMNKATALSQIYKIQPRCEWFYTDVGNKGIGREDWILSCADNHRARRSCLEVADDIGCNAIIMGNGFTDADAYVYLPDWQGRPVDPRVRYPEIATEDGDDPIASGGCTGHVQDQSPQLVLANVRAACHGLQLLWFYVKELPDMTMEVLDYPVELGSNKFGQWAKRFRQVVEEYRANQTS